MKKEPLLFLCHRIPFPPNKGDKIRSFNMLKELAKHYEVYLGAFVDDSYDWQYASKLDEYCQDVCLLGQNKTLCKIKGLTAFLTGKAISLPYYYDGKMASWTSSTIKQHGIKKIFVYSSAMAQYAEPNMSDDAHLVIDFVDVDSDKWRQYSEGKSGISSWVYGREYRKLQAYESKVAAIADHSLFVSPQEADLFKKQVPATVQPTVQGVLNGVDTAFFDPEATLDEALDTNPDVVFTGAMDYWANVDAVVWFEKHVWPKIRTSYPEATFYVVGGNPTAEIKALDGKNGIVVTGRVKDVRPYILLSKVSVAPLQIARGIQNKVLEAMSMAKPVVATSMANEGIEADTANVKVTDDANEFSTLVCDYLSKPVEAPENRTWIVENLQWNATLSVLPRLFDKD